MLADKTVEPQLYPALQAVARAYPEILSVYGRSFTVETKADRSPVTEADRNSNQIITDELSRASSYPILSEEGGSVPYAERRGWKRFWLVDPLDGTKEFVKRNGEFTINVALVETTVPVLGVVYAPVLDLLYFAWEDGQTRSGSYRLQGFSKLAGDIPRDLAERAVKLPRQKPFDFDDTRRKRDSITVIGSRSHGGPAFREYVRKLKKKFEVRIEIMSRGSALKPCLVADGTADIYPRFGPTMEWDTAAAHAVIRGVGKRMVAMEAGRELVYNKERLVNPSFLVY